MPALISDQALQEPQSVKQAEAMIHQLKDEIAEIHDQANSSRRKSSMDEKSYRSWRFAAMKAARHKKGTIRRISLWLKQGHPPQGRIRDHIEVGSTLKFAARQYGKLIEVFAAAGAYVDSTNDEDEERAFSALSEALEEARKYVTIGVPNKVGLTDSGGE